MKSPFNYNGTKQNILDFLFNNFDKSKETFVDLFCGGGSVAIEALNFYNKVKANDLMKPLINFYKELQSTSFDDIVSKLELIKLNKEDSTGYHNLREKFNSEGATDAYMFYMLCCCCNSNMIRFNKSLKFNQTFGKRTFNDSLKEKLKDYSSILYKNNKIEFINKSFSEVEMDENCFVYLDPPYIQTEAGYNCFWNKELENKLYDYIDALDERGIHFALSNTLYHHGELNWAHERIKKYNIIEVPTFYNKLKKQDFDKKSEEILVINY